MTQTGKMVTSAVFVAFGVVLPIAFHFAGAMGSVFLPMHIPVLLAGLFLGTSAGFTVGMMTPVLSSFLTGMPPIMPMLPLMIMELAFYGALSGYLYQTRRWPLYTALIAAMIGGRITTMIGIYFLTILFKLAIKPVIYVTAGVINGLPGIVIQIILVPLLVKRLETNFSKEKNTSKESVG